MKQIDIMKVKTWEDMSVRQWQDLTSLYLEQGNSHIDLMVRAGAIVYGVTEERLDGLSMAELNDLGHRLAFTHTEVPAVAVEWISVNKRRYRCIYDVTRMPAARYIESKIYGQDPNQHLHRIMASMIYPQKRVWKFGPWIDDKYDAAKHSEYADDMLDAPITAVLGSVVFFCNVYLNLISSSRVYFTKLIMQTARIPRVEAEEVVTNLCSSMDGIIKPSWLRRMNE